MITIELTDLDFVAQPFYLNVEQTVLSLLKDRGAPVLGVLYMRIDPSYDINFTSHPLGSATYVFKKRGS